MLKLRPTSYPTKLLAGNLYRRLSLSSLDYELRKLVDHGQQPFPTVG